MARSTALVFGLLVLQMRLPAAEPLPRQMERLDRGLVAIHAAEGEVFLSWRLLGDDPQDVAFNVYRTPAGGEPVKLNSEPLTKGTCYFDREVKFDQAVTYSVLTAGPKGPPGGSIA